MKIFNGKPEGTGGARRATSSRAYGEVATGKSLNPNSNSPTDKVKLSSEGAGLAEAIRAIASEKLQGASDTRLAELKEAIEDGSYQIEPTALAEAILEEDFSADGGDP